jgi:hypothetical protein
MSELKMHKPRVVVETTMVLSEDEVAALEALAGYGTEEFLRVFYERLGKNYLRPHEAGLRSLFATIRRDAPTILHGAKKARAALGATTTAPQGAEGEG